MRRAFTCLKTQLAMVPQLQTFTSSASLLTSSSVRAHQRVLAFSTFPNRQVACSAAGSKDAAAAKLRQGFQHPVGSRAAGLAALGWSAVASSRRASTLAVRRHINTSCLGRDSTTTAAAASAVAAPPLASRVADVGLLLFMSGAFEMPHPEKVAKGGEDSHFVADCNTAVGVADGVGGWAEVGVDAGIYSKMLMRHVKDAADGSDQSAELDPQELLVAAYKQTNVQGSATACIVCLHPSRSELVATNLGDSGFLLVRDGQIAFQSPPQQHDFNFPFQLGSVGSMSDPPESAQHFRVAVQPGDTLVVGTDGLFDNVFAEEVAAIVYQCRLQEATADITAQVLCQYARTRAADKKYPSPFAQAAFQNGFSYMGGKMDDITVVVSYLEMVSEL